jgi:hypothetical protein
VAGQGDIFHAAVEILSGQRHHILIGGRHLNGLAV